MTNISEWDNKALLEELIYASKELGRNKLCRKERIYRALDELRIRLNVEQNITIW